LNRPADRDRLLGIGRFQPPDQLRGRARYPDAEARGAFLAGSHRDPAGYWAEVARELAWIEEPSSVGGPGAWFPGGRLNLTAACLDAPLALDGDACAVLTVVRAPGEPPVEVSRRELLRAVGAFCRRLEPFGLSPGDRVLLAIPRGGALVAASLACLRLGLTCVPQEPAAGDARQIVRRTETAGCVAAVYHRRALGGDFDPADLPVAHRLEVDVGWEGWAEEPPAPLALDPMHPALVLAESSGRMHTLPAAGLLLLALSAHRHLLAARPGEGGRYWLQTPAHHASFTSAMIGALAAGDRIVVPAGTTATTRAELVDLVVSVRPLAVLIHAADLGSIAASADGPGLAPPVDGPPLVAVEGADVPPGLFGFARRALFTTATGVVQVLARPELAGFVAGPDPCLCPVRPASAGPPAPGVPLTVVDHHGNACSSSYGGIAALAQCIPSLSLELQCEQPPIRLGVRARIDREGMLWPMGEARLERDDEAAVSVQEIEAAIARQPGVDQVAVIRYTDPHKRVRVAVFVRPLASESDLAEQIRAAVRERFGERTVPDSVQVVDQLPVSRTGKLLRTVLRHIAEGDVDELAHGEGLADESVVRRILAGRLRED